ncbi:hypothetical protein D3C86_1859130 [compost metagenome]
MAKRVQNWPNSQYAQGAKNHHVFLGANPISQHAEERLHRHENDQRKNHDSRDRGCGQTC